MLFLTDAQSMNFIVNYNMLGSTKPSSKLGNLKSQFSSPKAICSSPNKQASKLSKIFVPYNTALSMSGSDEQSQYVFN